MSFKVCIEMSGEIFSVEENESVLDAALRHGLGIPYSCRNGQCGSCKGRIISGRVNYAQATPALSKHENSIGMALFCRAIPQTDLVIAVREVTSTAEIMPKKLPCRVAKMELLAPDVMRLYLKLPATELLQFIAGQYIDFILHDGERRSFSLANPPHVKEFLELHVRHVPGGAFAEHVFTKMKEKDILRIEGPYGSFSLREESARPMLFMAGGTGFAPIKGIIEHAFALGVKREMRLYWGARAKRDLYLNDLALAWVGQHPHFTYVPVLSEPTPDDNWQGKTGLVHNIIAAEVGNLNEYDVYASGPPVMVKAGHDAFVAKGLSAENYFYDAFEFAHAGK